MKVTFKQLAITNFKGVEHLEFDFGEKETRVFGANETGKTTIADAIFYVLTGKNSLNESSFDIIPVGNEGKSPMVSLTVEIVDDKGTHETVISREYKASFNRDREFTGNYSTVCYIGGVKSSVKDFETWINDNVCNTEYLRLVFDTRYFTERIAVTAKEKKWEAQRRLLFNLCGVPTDLEIAKSYDEFHNVAKQIENNFFAHTALKAEKSKETKLQASINSLTDSIEDCKERIKQPNLTAGELNSKIDLKTRERKTLYDETFDLAQQGKNSKSQFRIERENRLAEIRKEMDAEADKKQELLQQYEEQCKSIRERLQELSEEAFKHKTEAEKAVIRGKEINELLDDITSVSGIVECPTCHQNFPQEQLNSERERLQGEKAELAEQYKKHVAKGKELNKMIASIEEGRKELKYPENTIRYNELAIEQDKIRAELETEKVDANLRSNIEENKELLNNLDKEILSLTNEKLLHDALEKHQADLDQALADRAKCRETIDTLRDFVSKKCEIAEERINNVFGDITFELFEKNKTNDDVQDVCNIYYKGVPFEALSYSTKFIVGYNIAYGFQNKLGVSFPVVVDNAESIDVGNPLETQAIYLIKRQENCPECGGETGRKGNDGLWKCNKCGHEFQKSVEIVSE